MLNKTTPTMKWLHHAAASKSKQDDSNNEVAPSRGGEQIDDVLDGLVGAVVGGFESAVWAMLRVRTVVEAAVGERSAQPFMEQQEEQRDLDAFCGEAVGVARAVALDQSVALELTQVVTQLVQAIGAIGQMERGEDSGMDFFGRPAADVS